MIFLGYTFAGDANSIKATSVSPKNATTLSISGGAFDELYVSSSALDYSTTIPTDWSFNTQLYAKFNGSLLAGNVTFAVSEVSSIRVKRRYKGNSKWITLYEQTVSSADDLNVLWYDKTIRSNKTYEYTIVPVFDQVEGSFFTNSVSTEFIGLIILDKENIFQTELDVNISEKRNKPRAVIATINRKYPFMIANGSNDYDSGSVSAQWLEYESSDDSWDTDTAHDFVHNLKDFLNNGSAKILKYEDGRMWLIEVSSPEITDSEDENHLQVHTSFEWVEIGDCEDACDLYTYDIIDVDEG